MSTTVMHKNIYSWLKLVAQLIAVFIDLGHAILLIISVAKSNLLKSEEKGLRLGQSPINKKLRTSL